MLAAGRAAPQAAAALVGELHVLVPMAGLIDAGAEAERLGKLLAQDPAGPAPRRARKLAQRELRAQRARRRWCAPSASAPRELERTAAGLERAARARARDARRRDAAPTSARGGRGGLARALETLETVILGKPAQIRLCLACLLARGHLLIEDVPGRRQDHARACARARARASPGSACSSPATCCRRTSSACRSSTAPAQRFDFRQGPIFTQLLLADEVNRASPRTQSALLEAMEERQVSADGTTYALPEPFFVVATQNPHEQLGTFALPESQLDRFLMRVTLGYPDAAHERALLRGGERRELLPRIAAGTVGARACCGVQSAVRGVHVADALLDYVQALIAQTRERDGPEARPVAARRPGSDPRRAGLGAARGPRRGAARGCAGGAARGGRAPARAARSRRAPTRPTSRAR